MGLLFLCIFSANSKSSKSSKTLKWPESKGDINWLNSTKKVTQYFDGNNQSYAGTSALGNGDQSENQLPLFELSHQECYH